MFLGLQQKGTSAKQGEKPLLIPDFVNLGTYDNREEEQETGNNSSGAKLVIRLARGKPKLEHVTLSMWVTANLRIMHELLRTGKLSATTTAIADYLAYTPPGGGGGHLGIFWVGMCRPGLQIGTPF